jgi:hypothetical protein
MPREITCTCCGEQHEWDALRSIGIQVLPADGDDPEERYDLRNCPACESTLSRRIT